jgi:hypothetical protein
MRPSMRDAVPRFRVSTGRWRNISWRWFCGAFVLSACTVACDREAPTRDQLENLIRQKATRQEVARQLGAGYELYEKNTENWKSLERYAAGEPPELREKAEQYPKAMFYTTAWTTTWVFLDERDVARDYYQGSQ